MKNQTHLLFKLLAILTVASSFLSHNVSADTVPVIIYKIGLDQTIIAESEYRVWANVRHLGDANANITSRFYVYADPNGNYSDSRTAMPQSKVFFNVAPRADTIVEARIAKAYFKNDCVKIAVNAYDAGSNEIDSGLTQTVCHQPITPKALSGKWEWNNAGWVDNPMFTSPKIKLGAFLKQDNGTNWDYKTKQPQNVTSLEIQAKPHDAASTNQPYINQGSLMISASDLESNNAFFTISVNKCYDYKVRVSTADGHTNDPAFTTKITPSPWRLFTAGSECNLPNPIQKGKWDWMASDLQVVPPVLHLYGKLSRDDGTLWDLKAAKPKYNRMEVHSRTHTPTSFNQPYTNQYNVAIEPESVVNGTQTWSLESGCKDYEVRLDTFDGVTSNPNLSNKIMPSSWWRFMGGAACTLADTKKPAPAMLPVMPNNAAKPIDNLKPIIKPVILNTAPSSISPAATSAKPVSPAAVTPKPAALLAPIPATAPALSTLPSPLPAANVPIKTINSIKPIRKVN